MNVATKRIQFGWERGDGYDDLSYKLINMF